MDLSLVFCFAIVADAVISILIQGAGESRGSCACRSFSLCRPFSSLHSSVLRCIRFLDRKSCLVSSGSKFLPAAGGCLAARELIFFLAIATAIKRTKIENKLLSDIIAASIYVCSALAMMGFVFGLSLQGLLATSGIIAIVLGLGSPKHAGRCFLRNIAEH